MLVSSLSAPSTTTRTLQMRKIDAPQLLAQACTQLPRRSMSEMNSAEVPQKTVVNAVKTH